MFIDFAKAFDTVPHSRLLIKLSCLIIDSHVINWISLFVINNSISYVSPVTSGDPQGSALGPLLFLIDVDDTPISIDSSIRLFAVDCVIYRIIYNTNDHVILQRDPNKIGTWCFRWLIKINASKCKLMSVTFKNNISITNYYPLPCNIERVST